MSIMKILIALFFVGLPAAAQAAGMGGYGRGHGMMGAHIATVLYAVLAALGYKVLQHAAKETAAYVKRTGVVVGMVLVIVGLIGVLCGVANHVKQGMHCSCGEHPMMMQGGPEGKMCDMPSMPAMPEAAKGPEHAKKTK